MPTDAPLQTWELGVARGEIARRRKQDELRTQAREEES
jgi:hypothetical protein